MNHSRLKTIVSINSTTYRPPPQIPPERLHTLKVQKTPMTQPTVFPDHTARNRANAEHSTGPRSVEGKQKVRLNAVKHGATSRQALLPSEEPAAFDALSHHLASLYDPQTEHERDLLYTIRDLKWKIERLNRYENSFTFTIHAEALAAVNDNYADADGEPLDEQTRNVLAEGASYKQHRTTLNQLHRHGRTLRREMHETETEIRAVIDERLEAQVEAEAAALQAAVDAKNDARYAAVREAEEEMIAEIYAAGAAPSNDIEDDIDEADTDAGFVLHASRQPRATGTENDQS